MALRQRPARSPLEPAKLLEAYEPGDFFLAAPDRTMLGHGVALACTDRNTQRLTDSVTTALADNPSTVAVGALPFDTAEVPGHLILPERVKFAGPVHPRGFTPSRMDVGTPVSMRSVPEPEAHLRAVASAVAALDARGLRKVVLARALDVEFAEAVRLRAILHNLLLENTRGYTFATGLPGDRTLLGATPELLLSRIGNRVFSRPHAGSAPRSADPATDRANGAWLLASRKDRVEHEILIEALVEALRPFCRGLSVPAEPVLESTPAVWQLVTPISGELIDRDVTALRLAAALHPTPAICGSPTRPARELVGELEPFDRGYYAGTIGWVDAAGDGEWAVSVRCAEAAANSLRLYAGGGIVPASQPGIELDETSAKFGILLSAMGARLPD